MARARTVRVYQSAIDELVDDPQDPLSQELDDLAEEIREQALENARKIIPALPEDFLTVIPGKDTKGMFFRVQMTPHSSGDDSWGRYLGAKEAREHGWFLPAVEMVMNAGSRTSRSLRSPTRSFPRGAGFTL
jgi:hypothetical protein